MTVTWITGREMYSNWITPGSFLSGGKATQEIEEQDWTESARPRYARPSAMDPIYLHDDSDERRQLPRKLPITSGS
ncbi:hypothetical protein N7462_000232 [Penicillium macrosclerotiorum]|uniref:uncharacterized protein n=1 Tax=Penicillium macrosclerotiorum TaxID=303699 RepID=UPI002547330A|nr:uncharacterized protein N7462_000232 [Penicillium macrosclerotiorum]KAJ5698227.1 hypothetical protein N7462_000232 [Penicillium macrosclerotiorum]